MEFNFTIEKHIAKLSEKTSGWKKELCLVSWNNNDAKYDIRDWSEDYSKCGKGVTLSEAEARELLKALKTEIKDSLNFD